MISHLNLSICTNFFYTPLLLKLILKFSCLQTPTPNKSGKYLVFVSSCTLFKEINQILLLRISGTNIILFRNYYINK